MAPDVRPIFAHPELADPEYLRDLGSTKRLAELLSLDSGFRERFLEDPAGRARAAGLELDVEALRPLWDPETAREWHRLHTAGQELPPMSLSIARYRSFLTEKLALRDQLRTGGVPAHPTMAAWRDRQMRRCSSELGPHKEAGLVHAPVAFELAKGCSVGCWFCAVGAEKFAEHARYSELGGMWKDVLLAVQEVIGDAARQGFCYWATEPLDNPDYELFCTDFAHTFHRFPQTTTAIASRDPDRTRRLMQLSRELGCELNRFSILSLALLRRILDAFTPEDLVYVELLPLNKEAGLVKAFAGRARRGKVPAGQSVAPESAASTIACVSGFLFNMVDLSIRLVTPCNACDRWENGYWVVDQATFRDGEGARREMLRMIDQHMSSHLDVRQPLRFRPDLRWEKGEEGPSLRSSWVRHRLTHLRGVETIGDLIDQGQRSATEIAVELQQKAQISMPESMVILGHLFQEGLLDLSPQELE